MVVDKFTHILKNPDEIIEYNALDFKNILDEHPYFQSARSLYIKALKKQESFKYNFELKKTAAYTTNRNILFDFITSKEATETPSQVIPVIEDIIEIVAVDKSNSTEKIYATAPIEKSTDKNIEEELEIGKPIDFPVSETYSFNQWMQLASKKPIERKSIVKETPIIEEKTIVKSEKDIIIEKFITSNPKITPLDKKITSTPFKPQKNKAKPNEVMTETLARVYLEQKKYDNAIKAYEILSLKYPEKSGFFADQIKRIQSIQNNK